ncbi:MAG: hypothetical protein E7214_04925 [Clostridium sp.]|nr:hypothetical protein [Clostridium sp.]
MEWYCAVWNSDKVNNEMGAQIVYEKLCEGEPYLVSECEALNNFYDEITGKIFLAKVDRGQGYIIISCDFGDAETINDLVQDMAKRYSLSFFEPQNITFIKNRD